MCANTSINRNGDWSFDNQQTLISFVQTTSMKLKITINLHRTCLLFLSHIIDD